MIHRLQDKKAIARKRQIIRYTIGVSIFVLLAVLGVFAWSGKIFVSVGRPFWKAQEMIIDTAKQATLAVRTKSSVFNENERLIQENTNLKNTFIDYEILRKENEQLKDLLGRIPPTSHSIIASILAKPNRSPYDTLIIDGGQEAGMTEGAHVYADAKMPIGEVSKVYNNAALVMLYSNPGQTTEGILDGSNASVELLGRGGGNFEMSIPLDVPSEKGTLVLVPGISTEVLAVVDGILSSPTDPAKKVILHSPINIQNLKWVQVKK
jgi:cell shape-determining protein MreC